jgi:hypothetical protein
MRINAAEQKRRQRDRAKRGSRVISVEIVDWDAWCDYLRASHWLQGGVETDGTVRGATEAFIWDICRDYRQEQASEQLRLVRSPITGLIDREIGPLESSRLIKTKRVKRPGSETFAPDVNFELLEHLDDEGLDRTEAEGTVAEGGFQIKDT